MALLAPGGAIALLLISVWSPLLCQTFLQQSLLGRPRAPRIKSSFFALLSLLFRAQVSLRELLVSFRGRAVLNQGRYTSGLREGRTMSSTRLPVRH